VNKNLLKLRAALTEEMARQSTYTTWADGKARELHILYKYKGDFGIKLNSFYFFKNFEFFKSMLFENFKNLDYKNLESNPGLVHYDHKGNKRKLEFNI
jgi:hypothetical protein